MKDEIKLYATIETKSNYLGLNGKQVLINSFHGTFVNCSIIDKDETTNESNVLKFDVTLKEVKAINGFIK